MNTTIAVYKDHLDAAFPPEGFRLMDSSEIVQPNDLCCCCSLPDSGNYMWLRVAGHGNTHSCFGVSVLENSRIYQNVRAWATPVVVQPIFEGNRILSRDVIVELVERHSLAEIEEVLDWLENNPEYLRMVVAPRHDDSFVIDFTIPQDRGKIIKGEDRYIWR
jgi:hypothetical protein